MRICRSSSGGIVSKDGVRSEGSDIVEVKGKI